MDKMYLGKAIAELRESRNMSQTDLADACGIRQSTISVYESGKSTPGEKNLQRIASALGCSADDVRSISIKMRTENGALRDAPSSFRGHPDNFIAYITDDIVVSFRPIVRDTRDPRPQRFNPITDVVEHVLRDFLEENRDDIEERIAEEIEVSIGDVTRFLDDLKNRR